MTAPIGDTGIRSILLDIEGTTTPIDFVYKVLFPYARDHVARFIRQNSANPQVRADIAGLREEHTNDVARKLDPPIWREDESAILVKSVVAYVHWLMDRDRKSTALKSLQGKIWEAGYRAAELRSQVYTDVPPAFARWYRQKKDISIFSSGSVLAQKLLFAHTTAGDLTEFIRGYFNTTTGVKIEAQSYRRIGSALDRPAAEILFVSDVIAELDAARLAGMQTVVCMRPGRVESGAGAHPVVHTFDEILPAA